MKKFNLETFAELEIERRTNTAEKLAKKFPELKGLTFEEFLSKLPLELDFITTSEMFKHLNKD